jgi:uncharacterized integral membrane protein
MLRKILTVLILVPLAILIVALAVANREVVTVTFDPFGGNDPALALRAPLFVLVFVFVLLGVIIGGVAAWLNQRKWRRAARRLEREAAAVRAEADRLRHDLSVRDAVAPRSLRPPAA